MNKFIKFLRGSQAAYELVKTNNLLDQDTLYFIYSEDNAAVGALYLGTRLISGGDVSVAASALADLSDVITAETGENSFLVLDKDGKWQYTSLDNVVDLIEGELDLSDLSTAVSDLQTAVGAPATEEADATGIYAELENFYTKDEIDSAIAAINAITKKLVDTLPEAEDAEENVIYMVLKEDGTRDEYMYINDAWEVIGNTSVNLDGYVKTEDLPFTAVDGDVFSVVTKEEVKTLTINSVPASALTAVSDVELKLSDTKSVTIKDAFSELYESITWTDMEEASGENEVTGS